MRTVEVSIGGQSLTLRRSLNNVAALEREFKTLNLGELFMGPQSFDERTGVLLKMLSILARHRGQQTISAEELGDLVDVADIGLLVEKVGEVLGGDVAQDPRSLAPFVPTPESLVERMLDIAAIQPGEVFLDPCCGDGRTLAAAAKRGAKVIGHEIDEGRAKLSRDAVPDGDVRNEDGMLAEFELADVIFLYTLPGSNVKLQQHLAARCKSGCRVVSHAFDMPGWKAYHTESFEGRTFYAWRIADVRPQHSAAA